MSNQVAIFSDRYALVSAIDEWIDNETSAAEIYGDINTWDVSKITDFSALFEGKTTFDSDISKWDVSNGTNFYNMFHNALSFNQHIRSWVVKEYANLTNMFDGADLMQSNHQFSFTPVFNNFNKSSLIK